MKENSFTKNISKYRQLSCEGLTRRMHTRVSVPTAHVASHLMYRHFPLQALVTELSGNFLNQEVKKCFLIRGIRCVRDETTSSAD